ncbi:MAG: 50S ribosomal protein L4 [Candidatus Nealsonbacteria bacterium]|nr:50S ribosomal protein L4 [Candidatus Nealsonbacteria bacterium]
MKTIVYNQEKTKIEEIELPKEIFDVKMNSDLVHQVVVSQMSNQRKVIAHTKDRGEVRGGGRKPWRQKGTGRARHGSRRSPIWRGGGITFGPTKQRVFKKEIPKKMQRKALMMVLSAKAKNNLLLILDKIVLEKAKTKKMAEIILKLLATKGPCLIALPRVEKDIIRAVNNLPKIQTIEARNLNCLDLLSFKYLIMPKESIKVIEETFNK